MTTSLELSQSNDSNPVAIQSKYKNVIIDKLFIINYIGMRSEVRPLTYENES